MPQPKEEDELAEGWKLQGVLKPFYSRSYSVQWLCVQSDQIDAGYLDLCPEYQRDVVWNDERQIGLLDSLLKNYYIPPVIFAAVREEDGTYRRICVDGKQRLTAMHRFRKGEIPFRDLFTNRTFWYKNLEEALGNRRRQLLPEKYRREFDSKQISCTEFEELSDQDERDIFQVGVLYTNGRRSLTSFQRVQMGMVLYPGEKLAAIKTPRMDFVRQILSRFFFQGAPLADGSIKWNRRRSTDSRCIAQAICLMHSYYKGDGGIKMSLNIIEHWLTTTLPITEPFKDHCIESFDKFQTLVQDPAHAAAFVGGRAGMVSPIEVIMSAVLISAGLKVVKDEEMVDGITRMRAAVRQAHIDIRNNDQCQKTMLPFIDELAKLISRRRSETPEDGNDDDDDDEPSGRRTARSPVKSPPSTPAKRVKKEEDHTQLPSSKKQKTMTETCKHSSSPGKPPVDRPHSNSQPSTSVHRESVQPSSLPQSQPSLPQGQPSLPQSQPPSAPVKYTSPFYRVEYFTPYGQHPQTSQQPMVGSTSVPNSISRPSGSVLAPSITPGVPYFGTSQTLFYRQQLPYAPPQPVTPLSQQVAEPSPSPLPSQRVTDPSWNMNSEGGYGFSTPRPHHPSTQ
ncbi:hypothetical protein FISHEDRAFT_56940 [Fistulina hepatica ATCC 64428]|nr:hypothetical protein FISHEDRAFT_56940 [Fistulina hepatica ATCC 64428]